MKNVRLDALNREVIEETAQELQPGRTRAWVVHAGGKRFPVRQLVQAAANRLKMPEAPLVTPLDNCTSHQAVKLLGENGFEVEYLGT